MKTLGFLALIFLTTLIGCESSTDHGANDSQTSASTKSNGLFFSLTLPAANFKLTDTLTGVFKVINESDSVRQFEFANLQQHGFQLTDIYGRVALNYPVIFLPAQSKLSLEPDERKEYSIHSPFRDFEGELIETGKYKMSAFLLNNFSPQVIVNIEVR